MERNFGIYDDFCHKYRKYFDSLCFQNISTGNDSLPINALHFNKLKLEFIFLVIISSNYFLCRQSKFPNNQLHPNKYIPYSILMCIPLENLSSFLSFKIFFLNFHAKNPELKMLKAKNRSG